MAEGSGVCKPSVYKPRLFMLRGLIAIREKTIGFVVVAVGWIARVHLIVSASDS